MMMVGLLLALLLACFLWVYLRYAVGIGHTGRPSLEYTLPAGVGVFSGKASRRRTERVQLALPITVSGQDVADETFVEETHTKDLSGYGAAVVLSRQLRPGQQIVIKRETREATCRVVYEFSRTEGNHVYGVAFLDPAADLWGVCKLLTDALAPSPPAAQAQEPPAAS